MMQDANQMVNAQQAGLDSTEANLDTAQDNLSAGISELEEARDLRRKCCGCCGKPCCCSIM